MRDDNKQFVDVWWTYLRIVWEKEKEPIGQRYLRRLLVTFKFELNMCAASVVAIPGVFWLSALGRLSAQRERVAAVVLMAAAALLFIAAKASSEVLAKTRAELLRGVIRLGEAAGPKN